MCDIILEMYIVESKQMKRKLYKYEKTALKLVGLGMLFIIVSQMPGGYACFTDIFMGLGTGAISGCALLLVSGKKETELYEKELMRGVSDEVEEILRELFLIQFDVSRDKVFREKMYADSVEYSRVVYRIEKMLRRSAVILSRLTCNSEYKKCIQNAAKEKGKIIDIDEWDKDINNKVIEINSAPISNKNEAEAIYEFISNYHEQIKELKSISFDYNCKIKAEIKGIYTSCI